MPSTTSPASQAYTGPITRSRSSATPRLPLIRLVYRRAFLHHAQKQRRLLSNCILRILKRFKRSFDHRGNTVLHRTVHEAESCLRTLARIARCSTAAESSFQRQMDRATQLFGGIASLLAAQSDESDGDSITIKQESQADEPEDRAVHEAAARAELALQGIFIKEEPLDD